MSYVIRKDLVAQDLAIPDARYDGHYTDDFVRTLTFVAWVDEVSWEDWEDGSVGKFRDLDGDDVYLYSIDLDFEEDVK